jgi:transcriptional regulator with XRE-family HTH domain
MGHRKSYWRQINMEKTPVNMLGVLAQERVNQRGLGLRAAAREIGIAHTTLARAIQGEDVDLATAQKIADWLGVTPTSIIDAEGVGKDALAAQIAAVLEMEPKLAEVFGEAMQRVLDGQMDLATFKELAAYAAYRINTIEGDANAVRPERKTYDQGPM